MKEIKKNKEQINNQNQKKYTKGSKTKKRNLNINIKNAIRLKIIITMTTNHINQHRQSQQTLTDRKN